MKKQNDKINIFDVTNYIIKNNSHSVSNMKLQKLIYYVYAKYLVEKNKPIFINERMEAWLYGVVFPKLYKEFKHNAANPIIEISQKGNINHLTEEHQKIIDKIINLYGNKTSLELSDLNHQEEPWQMSWDNNSDWSLNVISDEIILKYFENNLQRIN